MAGRAGTAGGGDGRDLERCFELHGAPLVLKSDNGSAFIAGELRAVRAKWGVELLWSPPRTPRYNGAVESGIRWLKERTEHVALKGGRPGQWSAAALPILVEEMSDLFKSKSLYPRQVTIHSWDGVRANGRPHASV